MFTIEPSATDMATWYNSLHQFTEDRKKNFEKRKTAVLISLVQTKGMIIIYQSAPRSKLLLLAVLKKSRLYYTGLYFVFSDS